MGGLGGGSGAAVQLSSTVVSLATKVMFSAKACKIDSIGNAPVENLTAKVTKTSHTAKPSTEI